jgi:hypothetical protein
MTHPTGKTLRLTPPRAFITDLARVARDVPTVPIERRMNVATVAEARTRARPRPGWCALFIKAYSVVAARQAELRRAYVSFPWARLYEHPVNVATVAVERRVGDEDAVLFCQLRGPENQSLTAIDSYLRRCKEEPVDSIGIFRRILTVSALPTPFRRLLWWVGYHASGRNRARHLGTYGVSVISGHGAQALRLISPLTTTLDYGVIAANGDVDVRLTIDHRVLDGGTAARVLADVEAVLHSEVLSELHEMRGPERTLALAGSARGPRSA